MSGSASLRRRPSSTGNSEPANMLTPLHSNVGGGMQTEPHRPSSSILPLLSIIAWAVTISYFLITNFVSGPWPESLLSSNRDEWRLVHAISSMLFGGTIVISTIIEWLVVASKNSAVISFWFNQVPALDGAIVLPALTGAIISGVAQANQDYGSLREAPKYIIGSLHVLLTFAVWWVLTDVTTQYSAKQAVAEWSNDGNAKQSNVDVPRLLKTRRWSNIGSCLFVNALFILMALKPGHSSPDD